MIALGDGNIKPSWNYLSRSDRLSVIEFKSRSI